LILAERQENRNLPHRPAVRIVAFIPPGLTDIRRGRHRRRRGCPGRCRKGHTVFRVILNRFHVKPEPAARIFRGAVKISVNTGPVLAAVETVRQLTLEHKIPLSDSGRAAACLNFVQTGINSAFADRIISNPMSEKTDFRNDAVFAQRWL